MVLRLIELINGEKLITDLDHVTDHTVTVRETFVIAPQQQGADGKVNFAFVPWPIFKDDTSATFVINRDMIVTEYDPNQQLKDNYTRALAQKSGLFVPSAPTLLRE